MKRALVIGRIDDSVVLGALKSSGREYVLKQLRSSPDNWTTIAEVASAPDVDCIIAKMVESDLFSACLPSYNEAATSMLRAIAAKPHILLLYRDNLDGQFSCADREGQEGTYWEEQTIGGWCSESDDEVTPAEALRLMQGFVRHVLDAGLQVAPYKTKFDAAVACQDFIASLDRHLLLRIYIPKERLWSAETEKIIELFREYVQQVERRELLVETVKTTHGTIISLVSPDRSLDRSLLDSHYASFTAFLSVCASDPGRAESLLHSTVTSQMAAMIVAKYGREAKRLKVDIEYQLQLGMLQIQHRLQSELLDAESDSQMRRNLASIRDTLANASAGLPLDRPASLDRLAAGPGITINIGTQYNASDSGVVLQTLAGDICYSAEDGQLLELMKQLATSGSENARLATELQILKDRSAPQSRRSSAWGQVQGFLSKVGPKIGESALKVLESYISRLLNPK